MRDLLDDLLDTAVASLTPSGDPYVDDPRTAPPATQIVAHGTWAWDCEAVVVHLVRLSLDSAPAGACSFLPTATVAATILRCYPKAGDEGEPVPDPATIDDAARVLAIDAAALAGGIGEAWADGSLFSQVPCGRVFIVPGVEPLGPGGGFAGWRVTIDVRL